MCQTLYCYNPIPALRIPGGNCLTGGTGTLGTNIFSVSNYT